MNHTMSEQIYFSCSEYYRNHYAESVLEILAKARYDELMKDDHDNFIAFIYACLKEDARDYQKFIEYEDHEYITLHEAIHRLLENMPCMSDTRTIKDYICKPQIDNYSPYYHIPLLYDYDPSYNYKESR